VVAKEHEARVVALRCVGQEIKERVVVWEEVLGVTGLGSDDVWALDGITAEEDGLNRLARLMLKALSVHTKLRPTMS